MAPARRASATQAASLRGRCPAQIGRTVLGRLVGGIDTSFTPKPSHAAGPPVRLGRASAAAAAAARAPHRDDEGPHLRLARGDAGQQRLGQCGCGQAAGADAAGGLGGRQGAGIGHAGSLGREWRDREAAGRSGCPGRPTLRRMPDPIRVARAPDGALTYAVPLSAGAPAAGAAGAMLAAWGWRAPRRRARLWGPPRHPGLPASRWAADRDRHRRSRCRRPGPRPSTAALGLDTIAGPASACGCWRWSRCWARAQSLAASLRGDAGGDRPAPVAARPPRPCRSMAPPGSTNPALRRLSSARCPRAAFPLRPQPGPHRMTRTRMNRAPLPGLLCRRHPHRRPCRLPGAGPRGRCRPPPASSRPGPRRPRPRGARPGLYRPAAEPGGARPGGARRGLPGGCRPHHRHPRPRPVDAG